jgi:hypothetical protein
MNKEIDAAIQSLLTYRNLAGDEDQSQAEELIANLMRSLR